MLLSLILHHTLTLLNLTIYQYIFSGKSNRNPPYWWIPKPVVSRPILPVVITMALNCSPIFLTVLKLSNHSSPDHISQYFIWVNDVQCIWLFSFSPVAPREDGEQVLNAFSHSQRMIINQYGLQSSLLTLTQIAPICQELFCYSDTFVLIQTKVSHCLAHVHLQALWT